MKFRLGGDSHPSFRPLMVGTTRTVGTTGIISTTATVGTTGIISTTSTVGTTATVSPTGTAFASHGCLQQLCMSPPTSE